MAWKRKMLFWLAYLTGKAPWDTGVTPPEVIRLVQSGELTPGCAVDLGCGTGLITIFLIRRGWQVAGVDSEPIPLRRARRRAAQEVPALRQQACFMVADVTDWRWAGIRYDLALDIGCLHSLTPAEQQSYVMYLTRYTKPGAHFLLYARGAQRLNGDAASFGLDQPQVEALLAPAWQSLWVQRGQEGAHASAWYLFKRDET